MNIIQKYFQNIQEAVLVKTMILETAITFCLLQIYRAVLILIMPAIAIWSTAMLTNNLQKEKTNHILRKIFLKIICKLTVESIFWVEK